MLSVIDFIKDRFNPFTAAYSANAISDESHVIPASSPFWIRLAERPHLETPSTIEVWSGAGKTGDQYTEVSSEPAAGEFQVDWTYRSGWVRFHEDDKGKTVYVSYNGICTVIKAEDINKFLESTDVDNSSIEVNGSNQLQIKDLGVTGGKLADGAVSAEGKVASGIISKSKLKTTYTEVYVSANPQCTEAERWLSSYGFYPAFKVEGGGGGTNAGSYCEYLWGTYNRTKNSYANRIYLKVTNDAGGGYCTGYVYQTYVSASGKDHYIYLLVAKNKLEKNGQIFPAGRVLAGYSSGDHPAVHVGKSIEECPHPFPEYDPAEHEIILIDNSILEEINQLREDSKTVQEFTTGVDITDTKGKVKYKAGEKISRTIIQETRSILEIIMNDYEVDFDSVPEFTEREAKTIDKWGTLPGEIVDIIETRQIANIPIERGVVELKRQIMKEVPEGIQFKKLKKKGT